MSRENSSVNLFTKGQHFGKVIDRRGHFLLHCATKAFHPTQLRNSIREMYITVSEVIYIFQGLVRMQETAN